MPTVYFISDCHFGHKNLAEQFRGMTVEESDELIIRNWNSKVKKKDDIVYYLGDFSMDSPGLLEKYLKRLNGRIYIIGGNHDTRRVCDKLKGLGVTVMGCMEYKGYILTHLPVHKKILKEGPFKRYRGNIHGHIHAYELMSPKYISVAADINAFIPLTLDEIIRKQKDKRRLSTRLVNLYSYLKYLYVKLKRR